MQDAAYLLIHHDLHCSIYNYSNYNWSQKELYFQNTHNLKDINLRILKNC